MLISDYKVRKARELESGLVDVVDETDKYLKLIPFKPEIIYNNGSLEELEQKLENIIEDIYEESFYEEKLEEEYWQAEKEAAELDLALAREEDKKDGRW